MRARLLTVAVLMFSFAALAKAAPQVIDWPETGDPVLRFTIAKIRHIGSFGGQQTYVIDTQVDQLVVEADFLCHLPFLHVR